MSLVITDISGKTLNDNCGYRYGQHKRMVRLFHFESLKPSRLKLRSCADSSSGNGPFTNTKYISIRQMKVIAVPRE